MKKEQLKEEFIAFLKEKGCYDKFEKNLLEANGNGESVDKFLNRKITNRTISFSIALLSAFLWGKTPEGDSFWEGIHRDFTKYILEKYPDEA